MVKITKIESTLITPIKCPCCGAKVPRVGLLPESKIEGLSFRCKRCGELWKVKAE